MLTPEALSRGVYTASAGNMAQGVAWGARELEIPCTVVMPDSAPRTKVDAVERLGAADRVACRMTIGGRRSPITVAPESRARSSIPWPIAP